EDPNIAVAVDMHPDDLTPTAAIHTLGQGRPAFDKAIGIGQLSRLGVLRRLSVRSCCEARNDEHAGNERCSRSSRRRHNETSLQKLYGSVAVWRSPMAGTLRFILGNSAPPRQLAKQSTSIAIHAKELPFPEVVRNKSPGRDGGRRG